MASESERVDFQQSGPGRLVRTVADDGLRLDGFWQKSGDVDSHSGKADPARRVDVVVTLHGVGGTFYGGTMFDGLADRLLDDGVDVLRANTRGHDSVFAANANRGRRQFGSAFESIAESTLDVEAWTRFLLAQGYERIGLLGHSLGAIKALYTQSHGPETAIQAVIAMSPPRLCYRAFADGPERKVFLSSMSEAESLVRGGRGESLFEARFPFPLLLSGTTFVDKYGPQERYDVTRFLHQTAQPTLVLFGEKELSEGGTAFAGLLEKLRELPDLPDRIEFVVIDGADHSYSTGLDEAAERIGQWLKTPTC